jgi:hypothetical protein
MAAIRNLAVVKSGHWRDEDHHDHFSNGTSCQALQVLGVGPAQFKNEAGDATY